MPTGVQGQRWGDTNVEADVCSGVHLINYLISSVIEQLAAAPSRGSLSAARPPFEPY